MSKDYWQIRKQIQQLSYGKTLTSRVKAYVKMWEGRCYSNGIPDGDEVPKSLADSHRVPCYKKIALAILNNDHKLRSLGFSDEETELIKALKAEKFRRDNSQPDDLFSIHGMH